MFACFLVTVQMGKGDTGKSRDDDCYGFAYLPAPAAKKSREGHPEMIPTTVNAPAAVPIAGAASLTSVSKFLPPFVPFLPFSRGISLNYK